MLKSLEPLQIILLSLSVEKVFPHCQCIEHIASALEVDEIDLFDKAGSDFQSNETIRKRLLEQLSEVVNDVFDSMLR